ncbi:hypothetical protein RF55_11896 [Lasius niger]|uniref:Uncharacterized protein n=1 Tax=Lasius niger TaxID=67767 RepID=A0A0J7N7I7_LASNI|nr:hypothetical protein RF55_11896 [Lasius niger]
MNDYAIVLPNDDDKWLAFRNYDRKERISFVVYADLECALERKEEEESTSNTSITQHHNHKAFSVGYYVRCAHNNFKSMYRSYRGEKCVSWFVEELHDLVQRAKTFLDTNAYDGSYTGRAG